MVTLEKFLPSKEEPWGLEREEVKQSERGGLFLAAIYVLKRKEAGIIALRRAEAERIRNCGVARGGGRGRQEIQ